MAIDVAGYNQQFVNKVTTEKAIYNNAAEKYGVTIQKLDPQMIPAGVEAYWCVVGIHHLTGVENMGNHHAFCDVLDENGARINGVRLSVTPEGGNTSYAVIDKPTNEPGTNFPLFKNNRATIAVNWPDPALPSEAATGLSIEHADEETGNTWGHHSFYIVFQRTPISNLRDSTTTTNGGSETSPETAIAAAGQALIIPLNKDAMFYKVARQNNLGERLTSEYAVEHEGKKYIAQIYESGIVYAQEGDWGNTKIIPREN